MKAFSFAAAAAMAVALAGPALAADLANAGFETGTLDDWSVSGPVEPLTGTLDYYQVTPFAALEGDYFAQLTADQDGVYTTLSQSFSISDRSRISFLAAFLAFDDELYNDDAYVSVVNTTTNTEVYRHVFNVTKVGGYNYADWKGFSAGLQTAGDYTIEAGVANRGGDSDPTYSSKLLLDAVSVAAVPEPATWALMIAGFGLAGGALRRRRAAVTA